MPSSFFSSRFVSVHVVHPYSSIDVTAAWKKLCFILSVRSDFHIIDSLSIDYIYIYIYIYIYRERERERDMRLFVFPFLKKILQKSWLFLFFHPPWVKQLVKLEFLVLVGQPVYGKENTRMKNSEECCSGEYVVHCHILLLSAYLENVAGSNGKALSAMVIACDIQDEFFFSIPSYKNLRECALCVTVNGVQFLRWVDCISCCGNTLGKGMDASHL